MSALQWHKLYINLYKTHTHKYKTTHVNSKWVISPDGVSVLNPIKLLSWDVSNLVVREVLVENTSQEGVRKEQNYSTVKL